MKRVLIDTNIYLNFYRLSNQSLSSLTFLCSLIKEKKIALILPKQVKDEFLREKYTVAKAFSEKLEKRKTDIQEPLFFKSYPKLIELKKLIKKQKEITEDVLKEHKKRISNPKSKINQSLEKLFSLAVKPDESKEVVEQAYFRTLRGNPPRKGNSSFGDAIIWETILNKFNDEDLVIVCADGDFASEVNSTEMNEFLLHEWTTKSSKSIKLFTNLGEFINDFTKKSTIKKKVIEDEKSLNQQVVKSYYSSQDFLNVILNNGTMINPSAYPWLSQGSLIPNQISFPSSPLSADASNLLSTNINGQTCSFCGKIYFRTPTLGNTLSTFINMCPDCSIKRL